jgi:hypothetical protein
MLGSRAPAPVVVVRVRASVGRPGASAAAQYRRRRTAELAAWTRSLPWRVLALVAVGVASWLAAAQVAAHLAVPAGGHGRRRAGLAAAVPPRSRHAGLATRRDRGTADRPAAGP